MFIYASGFVFSFFVCLCSSSYLFNNIKDILNIGGNTTANNTDTNNVAAIDISIVVMPYIISSVVPPLVSFSKPFPDILKIEVFAGAHFKRWQERIFSVLDMYGVVWVLTDSKTSDNAEAWTHEHKVYRHSILSTLSNHLFNVYCNYKKAKKICSNMVTKYIVEDMGNQKFVIGKEMIFGVLEMHEVAWVFINPKTNDNAKVWMHVNKVCTCRHFILSTLFN